MKELKFFGNRLKDLYDYLSKEYGKLESDVINVDDHRVCVFVSERRTFRLPAYGLFLHVGCVILYRELNPNWCEIKIYCAGGGGGIFNLDYGAVEAAEKKVYKSILIHARELGLR